MMGYSRRALIVLLLLTVLIAVSLAAPAQYGTEDYLEYGDDPIEKDYAGKEEPEKRAMLRMGKRAMMRFGKRSVMRFGKRSVLRLG